jgi:hypothetical protein
MNQRDRRTEVCRKICYGLWSDAKLSDRFNTKKWKICTSVMPSSKNKAEYNNNNNNNVYKYKSA